MPDQENAMMYLIEYKRRDGGIGYAFVADEGDNGYSCEDAPGAGTHTYQSRSLRDVLGFSIRHSAWPTRRTLRGALRWLGATATRAAELDSVTLYDAPSYVKRSWKLAEYHLGAS